MDNVDRSYRCKICNKEYSSYKSLWNHNNKFHNVDNTLCKGYVKDCVKNDVKERKGTIVCVNNEVAKQNYTCENCNKIFSCRQSKYEHKKKHCKKDLVVLDNEIIAEPNKEITQQINNINNQQINNINTNNTNNGTINNTNNIIITQLGRESLDGFSIKDILAIVKEDNNMPIACVKKVNFNKKYPKNHSFCTTTLEGKHFTRINHKTQKPEKINKVDFINEVLDSSLRFINNISLMVEFDESFRDSIPIEHQKKIKDILDNQDKFHDPKNKKAFFNCINDMSYNFKDIILETWKLIQPIDKKEKDTETDDDEPPLLDENYKYISSDDEED